MKKFSTQVLAFAFAALTAAGAWAQAQQPVELAKDAPDKYVVVKGDTLWGIAGRFLQKPWRWPEIWQLNREQIRNPHLIYPGDIVYLDTSGGSPRLRLGRAVGDGAGGAGGSNAGGLPTERMQPRVRSTPLEAAAVPTIPSSAIEAFLNRPLVVDETGMAKHPRIVATQEGRVFLGRGELAYARGFSEADTKVAEWHIYRAAKPLLDPDTRKPIAYEALFIGSAKLERDGDPATLRIVSTTEEVGVGDRLVPAERSLPFNYVPHPPEGSVSGRIVSVYRGVAQAGRNSVVALNVGSKDGLEVGHVLEIRLRGRTVKDADVKAEVKLPDEAVGHLLIFRIFDKIAYGLVMDASQSISVGDVVANP
ncbi:MAG: LysM peptidoglycan-binding domain-containing protein [Burkholderiales bacterium]|nr:LysM peptidoglycan-binding domain-containing protein [Burkholderiales bacterium]